MEKPEVCEWGECKNKPKQSIIIDDEKYWFCSDKCEEEFWESIKGYY